MSARRIAASVLLLATLTGCSESVRAPAAAPRPAERPVAGAAGLGDPVVPGDGNGGYDVQHYDLDLRVTPRGRPSLAATATITADATQALSRFDLDLTGLTVSKVTVDGAPAAYSRVPDKLVVTPARPIARGRFTVAVVYSGTPAAVDDRQLGRYGWIRTGDGTFVGAEPDAAHTWFPGNDHPQDKATFGFRVTVPKGLTAVANGQLTGTAASGRTTTYTWRARDPMATYLAMVDVGRFKVRSGRTPGGIPIYVAVDPAVDPAGLNSFYDTTAKVTDAWAKLFGPYPFESTGGVVDDAPVQFALETQTKPEYVASMAAVPTVIAHELSHQWFGDSVSVHQWGDIWLNEGFATYAEWLWGEREGSGDTPQREFDGRYAQQHSADLWNIAPAAPGRSALFGRSVYERGAMTLQALRRKVGDQHFFAILRAWVAEHRYGDATTPQFVALAQRISGMDLRHLFQVWLYDRGRPVNW
ncbi:M1 family metallopeptidase [Actinomadura sp. DC4]|uniref:M1 family metallopeptidase n=1 Tax=Actinomadura sp. DC4 TaxID=3055069 RepID=UPI0025B094E4|nr:M1 family metallopeptidase [Actinomadura sp. DC4]MDN3352559.1 M1 family metallopeptidase [Actinomadura sp. DC4]